MKDDEPVHVGKIAQEFEQNMIRPADDVEFKACMRCGYILDENGGCDDCRRLREREAATRRREDWVWGGAAWRALTFEALIISEANRGAVAAAKAWRPQEKNALIHGRTGSGKSHVAVAMAVPHWDRSIGRKIVWKASEIARHLRSLESAYDEQQFFDALASQPMLIIDDLGAEKRTPFLDAVLYETVDGRDRNGLAGMIVTSNLTPNELASYLGDDRVVSRLRHRGIRLDLSGERDHRQDAPDREVGGAGA